MTSSRDDAGAFAGRTRRRRQMRLSMGHQTFVKCGLPPLDLHDPYYFAISLSWTKFFAVFVAAELGINLIFATLYSLQPGSVAHQTGNAFVDNLFFSLETLATVGYGEMYPATRYGHLVSSLEIVTGVIFTAITTGLLFVRFSRPKSKVVYATNAVVTTHNGKPTLMMRIGNARNSLLHDAHATMHVFCRRVSEEGVGHMIVQELALLRPRTPAFAILYTLMHVIDESSVLNGFAPDSPAFKELRFTLTVSAYDPAIGQRVTDIHSFQGDTVRFGMRYVDAIQRLTDTVVLADYALISAVEPEAGPAPAEATVAEMAARADALT